RGGLPVGPARPHQLPARAREGAGRQEGVMVRGRRLLLALSLAACATGLDPAAKEDIDRRVKALGPPSQTFTAASPTPLALVVGQWTQHEMIDDQGRPSFLTTKLVGEDLGSYW